MAVKTKAIKEITKESAISKINGFGRIGKTVTTVITIILAAVLAIVIFAGINLMTYPGNYAKVDIERTSAIKVEAPFWMIQTLTSFVANSEGNIDTGDMDFLGDETEGPLRKITLPEIEKNISYDISSFKLIPWIAASAFILVIIMLMYARKLFDALKNCESPFSDEVMVRLRNFSFSLILIIVSDSLLGIARRLVLNRDALGISIDIGTVTVIAVVLVVTAIFRYGAILQQESDETL